jgi:transposase-like protein
MYVAVIIAAIVVVTLAILAFFLPVHCPRCRRTRVRVIQSVYGGVAVWRCEDCGYVFTIYR